MTRGRTGEPPRGPAPAGRWCARCPTPPASSQDPSAAFQASGVTRCRSGSSTRPTTPEPLAAVSAPSTGRHHGRQGSQPRCPGRAPPDGAGARLAPPRPPARDGASASASSTRRRRPVGSPTADGRPHREPHAGADPGRRHGRRLEGDQGSVGPAGQGATRRARARCRRPHPSSRTSTESARSRTRKAMRSETFAWTSAFTAPGRPLRRQHEVHPEGPAQRRQPHQPGHELRQLLDQGPQLVDHDDEPRDRLGVRDRAAAGRPRGRWRRRAARSRSRRRSSARSDDRARDDEVVVEVGDEADDVGEAGARAEGGPALEVDQDEGELLRGCGDRQRGDERAEELGLARPGRAADEHVRAVAAQVDRRTGPAGPTRRPRQAWTCPRPTRRRRPHEPATGRPPAWRVDLRQPPSGVGEGEPGRHPGRCPSGRRSAPGPGPGRAGRPTTGRPGRARRPRGRPAVRAVETC